LSTTNPTCSARTRTLAAAVGSQRLTAWATARPTTYLVFRFAVARTSGCDKVKFMSLQVEWEEKKFLNRNSSQRTYWCNYWIERGSHEHGNNLNIKKFNTLNHPFPSTGLNKLRRVEVRVEVPAAAISRSKSYSTMKQFLREPDVRRLSYFAGSRLCRLHRLAACNPMTSVCGKYPEVEMPSAWTSRDVIKYSCLISVFS
jgi:hypothetical protein